MTTAYSHPALEIQIPLMSSQAQTMKIWLSSNLGGMFFMMEVVFSEKAEFYDEVLKTMDDITKKLNDLDASIQVCIDEQTSNKQGTRTQLITGMNPSVRYNNSKEMVLHCTTPQIQCCTRLLLHYDQLVQWYDRQWLLREMTRKEHQVEIAQWTARISKVLHDCYQQYRLLRMKVMADPTEKQKTPQDK